MTGGNGGGGKRRKTRAEWRCRFLATMMGWMGLVVSPVVAVAAGTQHRAPSPAPAPPGSSLQLSEDGFAQLFLFETLLTRYFENHHRLPASTDAIMRFGRRHGLLGEGQTLPLVTITPVAGNAIDVTYRMIDYASADQRVPFLLIVTRIQAVDGGLTGSYTIQTAEPGRQIKRPELDPSIRERLEGLFRF